MKNIIVPIITDTDQSRKFEADYYEGNGLYFWEESSELIQVSGTGVMCLYMGVMVSSNQIEGSLPDVVESLECEAIPTTGITEELLLKAIAVASDPDVISKVLGDLE